MAENQDTGSLLVEELSFSLTESLTDKPKLPNTLLDDGKTDTKHHQEVVTDCSKLIIEQDACTGISLEAQPLSTLHNSVKQESALIDALSSAEFHCSPPPYLSHIQNVEPDIIPSQHEDQSHFYDGVAKAPKEMETVSHKLGTYCTPDDQMNKTPINDDCTARTSNKSASMPSEKHHSTSDHASSDASKVMEETISSPIDDTSSDRVSDAQTNKSSSVKVTNKQEDMSPLKANGHRLHNHMKAQTLQSKTSGSTVITEKVKKGSENRGIVDSTTSFESVKVAVTKFGGITDWKAYKALTIQKRKHARYEMQNIQEVLPTYKKKSEDAEVAKIKALKELEASRQLVEELNLNLERAKTEAEQAKQDAELAQLRAKEMEAGISVDESIAAKAQLEVAKARHEATVAQLNFMKDEFAALLVQYSSLVGERDLAITRSEGAVFASKEMEKMAEDLTLKLIAAKESLESSHAVHVEAEEHRVGAVLAKDQDCLDWDKEIKQASDELVMLGEQHLQAKNLQAKIEASFKLLADLKQELAAYLESKLKEQSEGLEEVESEGVLDESKRFQLALASKRKELVEVMASVEKAENEVSEVRAVKDSLKSELERERLGLASMRQREGMASIAVLSIEAEIERTKEEIKRVREKEKEAREKMPELPKLLQQAALEADRFSSIAKIAREELRKVTEVIEQATATLSTTEIKVQATLKEIEASRASQRLALEAVKALRESEDAATMEESPRVLILPVEKYYALSKRALEVEEFANERVTFAISQIHMAKESEFKSLQRLEKVCGELKQRKEELRIATKKADRATEGKLGVEQQLRKWRAEHEQRRKASDVSHFAENTPKSPARSFDDDENHGVKTSEAAAAFLADSQAQMVSMSVNKMEHVLPDFMPKKKKSFFPRIIMFFLRRSHPRKIAKTAS